MRQSSARPFALGDLMILIAAVAGGFAFQRWVEGPPAPRGFVPGVCGFAGNFRSIRWFDVPWFRTPTYQALAATAALVVLRWRRPRPRFRRIGRQPGSMACLAVITVVGSGLLTDRIEGAMQTTGRSGLPSWIEQDRVRDLILNCGAVGVLGTWVALVLRGRWSPERSWLDRAGRVLGWYWLLGASIGWLLWPSLEISKP